MKTNISRPVDREYGYDLETEFSYSRDGSVCHGYINGECKAVAYGHGCESEVRKQLFAAVTFDITHGATPVQCQECGAFNCQVTHTEEQPMQSPTYAELVANREAAYIAQRDAENNLNDIKSSLTASIAADPAYKNDQARKAELANRLQDYHLYVDHATKTADAYRAALAAIEVYQEAAKDARAKLRYETALLELEAAKLQLQVAQARHDAAEPTDEDPWGNVR